MFSVEITAPKHLINPKNAFVATCVAMVGDGDEFPEIKLNPIPMIDGYEEQVRELVELFDAMKNFRWTNTSSYADLDNFAKWFNTGNDGTNGWSGGNPFSDDGFLAYFYSYSISYYDHDGIEYNVAISKW